MSDHKFTIAGKPVTDGALEQVLAAILENDQLSQFHDGNGDFTAAELGAILDADRPEANTIDEKDMAVRIGFERSLTKDNFVMLAKAYEKLVPDGTKRIRLGVFDDSKTVTRTRSAPSGIYGNEWASPVLRSIPADTTVLFVGETHGSRAIPKAATALLEGLKSRGFDVLAIEVDDKYQGLYDRFSAGEITLDELAAQAPVAKFRAEDGTVLGEGREFMETARSLGFKFLCVDHWDDNDDHSRDHFMAEHISKAVRSGKKVVYYVGSSHASKKVHPSDPTEHGVVDVDGKYTAYLLAEGKFHDDGIKVHSMRLQDSTGQAQKTLKGEYDQDIIVR